MGTATATVLSLSVLCVAATAVSVFVATARRCGHAPMQIVDDLVSPVADKVMSGRRRHPVSADPAPYRSTSPTPLVDWSQDPALDPANCLPCRGAGHRPCRRCCGTGMH